MLTRLDLCQLIDPFDHIVHSLIRPTAFVSEVIAPEDQNVRCLVSLDLLVEVIKPETRVHHYFSIMFELVDTLCIKVLWYRVRRAVMLQ